MKTVCFLPGITLLVSGAMPDTMTGSKKSLSLGTNLVPPYFSPCDWTGMLLSNCFNGQNPIISNSPVDSVPDSLTIPRFQREHLWAFETTRRFRNHDLLMARLLPK
jgi:hypothetical protein